MTWDGAGQIRHSLKAASLRREVENSLQRLGVEAIDLYQIHWPGFPPPARPSEDVEEGWRALADMRREGKLRHIGVSNFEVPELERLEAIAPVETLQPPYSLLRRQAERELLPYCQAHDIGVIVYSPMQSGLLTGRMTHERIASLPDDDWRKSNPYFQEPRLSRALEVVEVLRTVGARYGRSSGEIAIAWTLRHPAVTAAIVGARRPDQVDGIIGAADLRLSDTDVAEIEQALA
jgi:aryl-alcohol dehydrogenase-like predicted oxidoreductase